MKKLLLLGLVLGLTVLVSSSALGAIHDAVNGEFDSFYLGGATTFPYVIVDSWYSITPKPQYLLVSGVATESTTAPFYSRTAAKFFKNEQTFAEIWAADDKTSVKGTILTEPGFFLGMDYYVTEVLGVDTAYTMLSPGFRYDFAKNSFVALSIDSDVEDSDFFALDLDYKYINDKIKFFSQLYNIQSAATTTLEGGYYDVGCYFKVLPQLVIGAKLGSHNEYGHHHAGLTWKPSILIVDFKYELDELTDPDSTTTKLSCMANLDKTIALGLEADNFSTADDMVYWLKAKYNTNCGAFKLAYTPEYKDGSSILNLQYQLVIQ